MRTRSILVLAILLAAAGTEPTLAAQRPCNLARVASVNLIIAPGARAIFMPVTLNDTRKLLLVDTGGVISTLTPDVARDLSLPTRAGDAVLVNVAGQTLSRVALVERFAFGGFRPGPMQFLLHPADDRTARFRGDQAGTIAPDILKNYDVEIDFAAGKLNLFRHSSCSNAAYWSNGNAAAVKMDVTRAGHIHFPVVLDGRRLTAGLDTGMSYTTLDLGIARRDFNVDTEADNVEMIGSLNGGLDGRVYRRTFQSLSTGEGQITVGNPRMVLLPDLTGIKRRRSNRPDVILGLTVLQKLRMYIAYNDETIFFTPASGPPAALPLPGEAAPNSLATNANGPAPTNTSGPTRASANGPDRANPSGPDPGTK